MGQVCNVELIGDTSCTVCERLSMHAVHNSNECSVYWRGGGELGGGGGSVGMGGGERSNKQMSLVTSLVI